jgi:hypothetical protein
MTAEDWKRRSVLKSWAISTRTRRWKGGSGAFGGLDPPQWRLFRPVPVGLLTPPVAVSGLYGQPRRAAYMRGPVPVDSTGCLLGNEPWLLCAGGGKMGCGEAGVRGYFSGSFCLLWARKQAQKQGEKQCPTDSAAVMTRPSVDTFPTSGLPSKRSSPICIACLARHNNTCADHLKRASVCGQSIAPLLTHSTSSPATNKRKHV